MKIIKSGDVTLPICHALWILLGAVLLSSLLGLRRLLNDLPQMDFSLEGCIDASPGNLQNITFSAETVIDFSNKRNVPVEGTISITPFSSFGFFSPEAGFKQKCVERMTQPMVNAIDDGAFYGAILASLALVAELSARLGIAYWKAKKKEISKGWRRANCSEEEEELESDEDETDEKEDEEKKGEINSLAMVSV